MSLKEQVLRALSNGACENSSRCSSRRILFGSVDRDQLQQDYVDLMRKELQEASLRWSFDFFNDKPLLGGDYEWVEISGSWVPTLYRNGTIRVEPQRRAIKSTLEKENVPKKPESCNLDFYSEEKTPEKQHALKRKQTNITDFYQAKRRVVATTRKSGQ